MTEDEWLAATDPVLMLEGVRGKVSDRKLRLLAVACCRRILSVMPHDAHRTAVGVAERFADCLETDDERDFWYQEAHEVCWDVPGDRADLHHAARAACDAVDVRVTDPLPYLPVICQSDRFVEEAERRAQKELIHDIFGPLPLRTVPFDSAWRTSTVLALATGIYQDRAFERLPFLADALQDAGCDNEDVLTHCRSDGPHFRGCWVVDLVLGKE